MRHEVVVCIVAVVRQLEKYPYLEVGGKQYIFWWWLDLWVAFSHMVLIFSTLSLWAS